ncbi:MAG: FRG domain-containing protein [Candidatus Cloacimonetes bacterium]|nr:FRG domain-containing protein [Candidatus Cloacimonadota bacterium]
MNNDIRAESWNHLQELIFADSWNADLGRFRSKNVFRGLSDAAYQLETTLIRLGGDYCKMEHHLLRNFVKYAHRDVVERNTVWHWLSVAQHHGLPTRLMDWTYSPFVAMHFATANIEQYALDGVIWIVDYVKAHGLLPTELKKELEREGAFAFTVDMILNAAGSFNEFANLLPDEDFLLFFEPASIDDRFINQYALFSISSNPRLVLNNWLERYPALWSRIIIPSELKWEIRDKLDQSNITERVLFPGLDGLSDWLKRAYSPKR